MDSWQSQLFYRDTACPVSRTLIVTLPGPFVMTCSVHADRDIESTRSGVFVGPIDVWAAGPPRADLGILGARVVPPVDDHGRWVHRISVAEAELRD